MVIRSPRNMLKSDSDLLCNYYVSLRFICGEVIRPSFNCITAAAPQQTGRLTR